METEDRKMVEIVGNAANDLVVIPFKRDFVPIRISGHVEFGENFTAVRFVYGLQ